MAERRPGKRQMRLLSDLAANGGRTAYHSGMRGSVWIRPQDEFFDTDVIESVLRRDWCDWSEDEGSHHRTFFLTALGRQVLAENAARPAAPSPAQENPHG